jgi:GNAT superfamily N-acetyltransferase
VVALSHGDLVEIDGLRQRASDFFCEVGDRPPTIESLVADLDDLPEGYTRADECMYRAYVGGVLVGYAEVLRGYEDAGQWIIGIALVDQALRGRGIGRAIVEAVAQDACAAGVKALAVGVIATREGSLRFWRREGFTHEVRRRTLSIGDHQHEIVRLQRRLGCARPSRTPSDDRAATPPASRARDLEGGDDGTAHAR